MNNIVDIIRQHIGTSLTGEGGERLQIKLNKGAMEEELVAFEKKHNIKLPQELRQMLAFSNGLDLYGLRMIPLDEMLYYPDSGLLGFHNWGNGDFDCISIDYGAVIFMQHSEENISLIRSSLGDWVKDVINEVAELHTLLHPMDYDRRTDKGMYSNVRPLPHDRGVVKSPGPEPQQKGNTVRAVEELFNSQLVVGLDKAIVTPLGWNISKGNKPVFIKIVKSEIDCSTFTVGELAAFMQENKQLIVDFAIQFQEEKEKVATLSPGISITFALFVKYLVHEEKKLLDFIKCRRIPGTKGMLNKLLRIKKELGF